MSLRLEHQLTAADTVPGTPARVFDRIADIAGWGDWWRTHTHFHAAHPPPEQPAAEGDRFRQLVSLLAPAVQLQWRIETVRHGRLLKLTGTAPNRVRLELRFGLRSAGKGITRVRITLSYGDGMLAGSAGESLARHLQPELEDALDQLAKVLIA